MGISLQALGNTLVVSLFDENFETVQNFLRSGVDRDDITGKFDRYQVMRYTGGRLMSATLFSGRPLMEDVSHLLTLDGIYRPPSHNWNSSTDIPERVMELLGQPGPSLYYDWQEDDIDETTYLSGLVNWPPSYWPFTRYPSNLCFSPWITIPGATLRAFAEAPCVARVYATALGQLNFTSIAWLTRYIQVFYDHRNIDKEVNKREFHIHRFSLFVDTNPELHDDEFENNNSQILNPVDGTQADYCSWKQLKEKAFYTAQRESVSLLSEVALKGNRYYNFSFKFRAGGLDGWVCNYTGVGYDGPGDYFFPYSYNFVEEIYSTWHLTNDPDIGGVPTVSTEFTTEAATIVDASASPGQLDNVYAAPFAKPYLVAWESAAIHVEFYYNRSVAYLDDSTHDDFNGG